MEKNFIIEKEYTNYTIAEYLKEVQSYSSRSIRKIEVYLNNKKVKPSKKIRYLNRLKVVEKEKGTNLIPIKMDLDIAYEDENILAINKEPFIVVHPTLKKTDKTLANGILNYFVEKYSKEIIPRFYNRLDMNTSGIILIAKNSYTQAFLQDKAEIKKYYLVLVKGLVDKKRFIIEKPVGVKDDNIKREIMEDGQYAKTAFTLLKVFKNYGFSLLKAELFTGRTHQIRVHLSSEGYPVLGDELYGGEFEGVNRQFLHSYKTIIKDGNKKIFIKAKLAKDIENFIKKFDK